MALDMSPACGVHCLHSHSRFPASLSLSLSFPLFIYFSLYPRALRLLPFFRSHVRSAGFPTMSRHLMLLQRRRVESPRGCGCWLLARPAVRGWEQAPVARPSSGSAPATAQRPAAEVRQKYKNISTLEIYPMLCLTATNAVLAAPSHCT